MLEIKRCSKCNGEMVECSFQNFPMIVKGPNQKLFVNKATEIVPYVCINCGYTELYAKKPSNLI